MKLDLEQVRTEEQRRSARLAKLTTSADQKSANVNKPSVIWEPQSDGTYLCLVNSDFSLYPLGDQWGLDDKSGSSIHETLSEAIRTFDEDCTENTIYRPWMAKATRIGVGSSKRLLASLGNAVLILSRAAEFEGAIEHIPGRPNNRFWTRDVSLAGSKCIEGGPVNLGAIAIHIERVYGVVFSCQVLQTAMNLVVPFKREVA